MDDLEEDPAIRLGVSANLGRIYASDHRAFAESLASMLESALPGSVRVERRGGVFTEKRISSMDVNLDEHIYGLELLGAGMVVTTRSKIVRGIKLKTETLPVNAWLDALSTELEKRAESNLQARNALKQFLNE